VTIVDASPTIANCTFSNNTATGKGGGIYKNGGSPTITECILSGNTAQNGGGMYNGGRVTADCEDDILLKYGRQLRRRDQELVLPGRDHQSRLRPQFDDQKHRRRHGRQLLRCHTHEPPVLFEHGESLLNRTNQTRQHAVILGFVCGTGTTRLGSREPAWTWRRTSDASCVAGAASAWVGAGWDVRPCSARTSSDGSLPLGRITAVSAGIPQGSGRCGTDPSGVSPVVVYASRS
jgi:predicted outer membrane repeat protein